MTPFQDAVSLCQFFPFFQPVPLLPETVHFPPFFKFVLALIFTPVPDVDGPVLPVDHFQFGENGQYIKMLGAEFDSLHRHQVIERGYSQQTVTPFFVLIAVIDKDRKPTFAQANGPAPQA